MRMLRNPLAYGINADEKTDDPMLKRRCTKLITEAAQLLQGNEMIVVPTSVIVNWETEFKRFAPGLKVLCYYGSAKRRKELRTGWTKTNWNHVVITSYQVRGGAVPEVL
jgi:SNF2 family DNA or RNA helicase